MEALGVSGSQSFVVHCSSFNEAQIGPRSTIECCWIRVEAMDVLEVPQGYAAARLCLRYGEGSVNGKIEFDLNSAAWAYLSLVE